MTRYATEEQFAVYGLPEAATADLDPDVILEHLDAASAVVDGMIASRGYIVPLTAWDKDLSSAVCKLAAYDVVFHTRGANPADPAHAAIAASRDWAERHIEKVAKGLIQLSGTTPARNQHGVAEAFGPEATMGTSACCVDTGNERRGW